ncbi:MAG: agmatinase [Spirochaetia bacterium]|nr:agmatinase [Spirochaetia bacterium]MCF7940355.1 agmatinase [Spirochaetia bacterium]
MNALPWFLASEIPNGPVDRSRFHIIPAPLERSVSYGGGTARGPEAILRASDQLEVLTGGKDPSTGGIHTQRMIDPQLETAAFLAELEGRTSAALDHHAIPVTLGGEHTVSFAPIAACCRTTGSLGVIQFDAHADLRKAYEGNRYSHASVMQRVTDELQLPIFQLGVRALCEQEVSFRLEHDIHHVDGDRLYRMRQTFGEQFAQQVLSCIPDDFPNDIYITIDVDAFDPSFMPATGTPVPGGVSWYDMAQLLQLICSRYTLRGFDVVELAPIEHLPYCDFSAAQLIYDIMGYCS